MLLLRRLAFCFSNLKNPYQVLGIKRNATTEEIKMTYRLIAQKYHPDKNKEPSAHKIFIQAKQAYETLVDEDKRKQLDNELGGSRSYGFDKNPFDEYTDQVFKDKSRTYHDSFNAGSTRKRKGDNILKEVKVSFLQAVKGAALQITFDKKSTCPACEGNKCKPGTAPTRCLACGGSGSTIYRRGGIVMHLQCERCKGIGLIIKFPCLNCKSIGILKQQVTEKIQIPSGVENQESVIIAGKGDQSDNGPNGDLIIKVIVGKHMNFRKVGSNIESTEWITVSQAALGVKKQIDTIWGKRDLAVQQGTQDGMKLILKGQGIEGIEGRGNHVVNLRVKIPVKLNEKQRRIFEELAREEEVIVQQTVKENDQDSVFEKLKNAFR